MTTHLENPEFITISSYLGTIKLSQIVVQCINDFDCNSGIIVHVSYRIFNRDITSSLYAGKTVSWKVPIGERQSHQRCGGVCVSVSCAGRESEVSEVKRECVLCV
jgi:hypothetical protein